MSAPPPFVLAQIQLPGGTAVVLMWGRYAFSKSIFTVAWVPLPTENNINAYSPSDVPAMTREISAPPPTEVAQIHLPGGTVVVLMCGRDVLNNPIFTVDWVPSPMENNVNAHSSTGVPNNNDESTESMEIDPV